MAHIETLSQIMRLSIKYRIYECWFMLRKLCVPTSRMVNIILYWINHLFHSKWTKIINSSKVNVAIYICSSSMIQWIYDHFGFDQTYFVCIYSYDKCNWVRQTWNIDMKWPFMHTYVDRIIIISDVENDYKSIRG